MNQVWEAARGLYSVALVVSLLVLARSMRPAFGVLTALAGALREAARALEHAAGSAEAQRTMAAKVDEIHDAVCGGRRGGSGEPPGG